MLSCQSLPLSGNPADSEWADLKEPAVVAQLSSTQLNSAQLSSIVLSADTLTDIYFGAVCLLLLSGNSFTCICSYERLTLQYVQLMPSSSRGISEFNWFHTWR